MKDFDLKKYLSENKLTSNSKKLDEIGLDGGNTKDFLRGVNPRDEKQFNISTSIEGRGERGYNVKDSLRVEILGDKLIFDPIDVEVVDDMVSVTYEVDNHKYHDYEIVFTGPSQGGHQESGNLEYLVSDVVFNYKGPK